MSTPYYSPTDLRPQPANASLPQSDVRSGQTTTFVDPHPQPQVPAPPASPQPTMVDQIAEDAAPIADYPPGSPAMRPLFRLPFRKRAEALRKFQELQTLDMPAKGTDLTMDNAAAMYDGLALIDEFLSLCAVDEQEYREWVAGTGADDAVFAQFWNAYQARMQPGEASSSSS